MPAKRGFGGRLTFEISPRTFGARVKANRNLRELELAAVAPDEFSPDERSEYESLRDTFGILMAYTEGICFEFDGQENRPLLAFQQFWEGRERHTLAENFNIRLGLADPIISEWVLAYHAAQEMVLSSEQKPPQLLTDEEREALQDPKAPSTSGD